MILKASEQEKSMAQPGSSVLYMQAYMYSNMQLLNPLSYS